MQLDEVRRQPPDVIEGVRALRVAGELDDLPHAQGRLLGLATVTRHGYISNRWARRRRSSVRGSTRSTCPCASWNSALWKPGGRSAYVACLITRGPVKPIAAPGSAMLTSPSKASDAAVPPKVGSVSTAKKGTPPSCRMPTAPFTFTI